MKRRIFVKGGLLTSVLGFISSSSLFIPIRLLASWNKEAFQAKDMASAHMALGDTSEAKLSDQIKIDVKDIAENAAVVPIKISTDINNAKTIRLFIEKNPNPLIAIFKLTPYTDNFVFIRTKMRETSNIIAMVEADSQLYMAKKEVKVTVGGCGG